MTWGALAANISGIRNVAHAVLTFSGTWAPPGVGYPSDVVNGLAQYVDDGLCYEVPVQAPWSFGPVGGPAGSPSYQESVDTAVDWAANWIRTHPLQTFVLDGYSQGAEAATRVLLRLMFGDLKPYLGNFIGGITFGNPSRGATFHAPTIADPGGRGISSTRMTELPTIDGRVIWADYVHSPANGDAGLDMYASVPTNGTGDDMTYVYTIATALQLHDFSGFTTFITNALEDAGKAVEAPISAVDAAIKGVQFLAAPGGPTAPHISYLGEIGGYSNLVGQAVGFLHDLTTAVPARCAA
nr:PE-PPE domain-containing protein [Mycobacterium eburneum]